MMIVEVQGRRVTKILMHKKETNVPIAYERE